VVCSYPRFISGWRKGEGWSYYLEINEKHHGVNRKSRLGGQSGRPKVLVNPEFEFD
jgi:hypothetical protein